jgi:hypothetical protein
VVLLKVGAVLVGLLTQGALKLAEYLMQGAERVLVPANPIDLKRYAGRKNK